MDGEQKRWDTYVSLCEVLSVALVQTRRLIMRLTTDCVHQLHAGTRHWLYARWLHVWEEFYVLLF